VAVAASIPQLAFAVLGAAPAGHTAGPTLRFSVEVSCPTGQAVRAVLLDTQIQIAARRRRHDAAAHERLFELFGPPPAWGSTLRTLLWTRHTLVVPPFEGSTVAELDVPCSYDLEVVASRYLDALADGEVPLEFLFSGSVFYAGDGGALQTTRIPWEQEAAFRLPVATWRATMEAHFRDTAYVRLPKAAFDRLVAFKSREALAGWGDVVDRLLEDRP